MYCGIHVVWYYYSVLNIAMYCGIHVVWYYYSVLNVAMYFKCVCIIEVRYLPCFQLLRDLF